MGHTVETENPAQEKYALVPQQFRRFKALRVMQFKYQPQGLCRDCMEAFGVLKRVECFNSKRVFVHPSPSLGTLEESMSRVLG